MSQSAFEVAWLHNSFYTKKARGEGVSEYEIYRRYLKDNP